MSIKQLHRAIRSRGGYILSDGTCNYRHLLPKAYDLIVYFRIRGQENLLKDIQACFEPTNPQDGSELPTFESQYYGRINLVEESKNNWLASSVWNEDIFNLFNKIAPRGYYFGSSEGDGACIGWFKNENEY